MNEFLEAEMQGAIFCDPKFVDSFLPVRDSNKLHKILGTIDRGLTDQALRDPISAEHHLYAPLCQILNVIKQAVNGDRDQHTVTDDQHDVHDADDSIQTSPFLDAHAQEFVSFYDDMAGISPDLVWLSRPVRHWDAVRMPIEVTLKSTYLKAGMRRLTRYARMVFAHQLHRRHLYGMVICEWHATIVRFDRCGILYSEPMDVREAEFHKAFVGLVMLDEEGMGYDTAFTTRVRRDGLLEYYVDLPEEAFAGHEDALTTTGPADYSDFTGPSNRPSSPAAPPTRRLKVTHLLCRYENICGRATTVLRVRPVVRPGLSTLFEQAKGVEIPAEKLEVLGTRDFVLKLMWRDPNEKTEGDMMERLVGVYGVGQHMWHADVYKACSSPGCARSTSSSCGFCLDRTTNQRWLKVSPKLQDLNIALPEARGDEEPRYEEVNTDRLVDVCVERVSRIYCRLLMSTIGSPLSSAKDSREFLRAILDAILGYWKMFNMGLLHRDISDGNVLLLREPHGYSKRKWEEPLVHSDEADSELVKSEKLLQEELNKLGDPTGVLNDFDLSALHGLMGASFFRDSIINNQESESQNQNDINEPEPKRRKLNSDHTPSPASNSDEGRRKTTKQKDSALVGIAKADKGIDSNIDFRMGTPSFMSTRIIKLGVGQPYEHHFTDDLESFFWLILWCTVGHVDTHDTEPTETARWVIYQLSRPRLSDIAIEKSVLLMECFPAGEVIEETLKECSNNWANDPAIISVVQKLGLFFFNIYTYKTFSECIPSEVFPKIVRIITDALEL